MATRKIKINRAPVLTLWAVVVGERLGFKREEALTLAKGLTGLTAQAHGQTLGIFKEAAKGEAKSKAKQPKAGAVFNQRFFRKQIPVMRTKDGIRAVSKSEPIKPESVERYLQSKFGEALPEARAAMEQLAKSMPPKELSREAYALYGQFTPKVPMGAEGWGAKGELDLDKVRLLIKEKG
jgi:hypothetical protein